MSFFPRAAPPDRGGDAQMSATRNRRATSLITVNQTFLNNLPGVNIIPLHDDRAFLRLRTELRKWRWDRTLRCYTRASIAIELPVCC
jgi:hypothetical protein